MSAPYWNLRAKVQDAVAAYLVSASSGEFIASDDWAGSPTLIPVRVGFTADLISLHSWYLLSNATWNSGIVLSVPGRVVFTPV